MRIQPGVSRYDCTVDLGEEGWTTLVTPEEMLIEILQYCSSEYPDVSVIYSYAPGDTDDMVLERNNRLAEQGLEPFYERIPGRHQVSLWRKEYDAVLEEGRPVKRVHFIFETEPDESLGSPNG